MICCDDAVPRRPPTAVLAAVLAVLTVCLPLAPAHAADRTRKAPVCAPVTVEDSAKRATAVFSGTVSDQVKTLADQNVRVVADGL